jgi:hypothetical protein
MPDQILIRDLLDLPEQVRKGAFVLKLTEGISNPQGTVDSYAITPALAHAFDQALGVIGEALGAGRSRAAYLHGSFGSGKSHFMAMLDLLLDGNQLAWARPELHPLRERYTWVGERRLLRLPIHMIGAPSLAQAVLSTYAEVVRRRHPEAPAPALFADGPLFEDAGGLRQRLGDGPFFAALNEGAVDQGNGAGAGFGDFARAEPWTAERFDAVVASSDPEERRQLYEALTRTLLPSYARQDQRFLPLDRGLGELSRHAAELGYDGVVLLLDELILWLAAQLSSYDQVHREAQQLVKLVEAQDEQRPAPVISFIARQRDLSEFVGPDVAGAERESLNQTLKHASGRFEEIVLADSNLPAIVEHRVVRPHDDGARDELARGFDLLRRGLPEPAWAIMLGRDGDETAFRQVYPFSPVVVDAMVALSDALQRERTAIRLLTELLVEHAGDLINGETVVAGDLYDVLAGGEEPFDHLMKERFDRARAIYTQHLLPSIQSQHGTTTADRCQRLRDSHPLRLGCSGCGERACRNANRLAKTVILAALVPQAAPFRDLTASRLVHLNHGTVATPIPGQEVKMVAQRLRDWAAEIGQLAVDDSGDPKVRLRLEGVDLAPILEQAAEADSAAGRRRILQEILFAALGLDTDQGSTVRHTIEWRGTKRTGEIRYGNVRQMHDDHLRCPSDVDWFLLVDYPFDDSSYTPEDDVRRIEEYLDGPGAASDNPGFAWLPTFFADELNRELGDLVKVEHIRAGDNWRKYLGHLRPDDQARARQDLESLASSKRNRIRQAMEAAYGVIQPKENLPLDATRSAEDHIVSLQPGLEGRPLLQTTFERALEELAERLLEKRWPHHPRFATLVTTAKLGKVLVQVERTLASSDHRAPLDSKELRLMRELAEPLGLLQCPDGAVILDKSRLRDIDQRREQEGLSTPSVADLRGLLDRHGTHGFLREVQDLLVAAYAAWSGRTIEHGGRVLDPATVRTLPDSAVLREVELPSEQQWQLALEKAGHLLGITIRGKVLTPANLAEVAGQVSDRVRRLGPDAERLPRLLEPRNDRWGVEEQPPRLQTARSGAELVKQLPAELGNAELIRRLADFVPETSATALGHSLTTAGENAALLADTATWTVLDQVAGHGDDPRHTSQVGGLLADLAQVLAADELNRPLVTTIERLTRDAAEILRPPDKPYPPPVPPDPTVSETIARFDVAVKGGSDIDALVGKLGQQIRSRLTYSGNDDDELVLDANVSLSRRRKQSKDESKG